MKFEVSPDAAAAIRYRGGQLWIWPSPRTWSVYATTEPPGDAHEWTTHRQAGFVVHVDDAIVPPERWAVELPATESRHLLARWMGEGQQSESGRIPLVNPPDEPRELPARQGWYERVFAGPHAVAFVGWLFVTALAIVGIHLGRFGDYAFWEILVVPLALLAVVVRWVWRRVRRVDASAP